MVSFPRRYHHFADALKDLIDLDSEAIDAYKVAIKRLENKEAQKILESFKKDYERQIQDLLALLGKKVPLKSEQDKTQKQQQLTIGKNLLAHMVGHNTLLQAMISNETDIYTAYRRIKRRKDIGEDTKNILNEGLKKEAGHKKWLENAFITKRISLS